MGRDKAGLVYHDQTQLDCAVALLDACTEKVYVSVREEQSESPLYARLPLIEDRLGNGQGPINGVLSALQRHSGVAWLVLACDMPMTGPAELDALVEARSSRCSAVGFVGADGNPEPLCAIYEPAMMKRLERRVADERYSLRRVLHGGDIRLLDTTRPECLNSINTTDEMARVRSVLAEMLTKEVRP
jgi:molybdenum cofactor guanylyltransferase